MSFKCAHLDDNTESSLILPSICSVWSTHETESSVPGLISTTLDFNLSLSPCNDHKSLTWISRTYLIWSNVAFGFCLTRTAPKLSIMGDKCHQRHFPWNRLCLHLCQISKVCPRNFHVKTEQEHLQWISGHVFFFMHDHSSCHPSLMFREFWQITENDILSHLKSMYRHTYLIQDRKPETVCESLVVFSLPF